MADLLNEIESIADQAGFDGVRQREEENEADTVLFYDVELDGGREQRVIVGHFEEREDGGNVIAFISPCEAIEEGWFSGLSSYEMRSILHLNSQFSAGHFCIWTTGVGIYPDHTELLAMRSTQLLESMDPAEFELQCRSVAELADTWEEKIGQDEF